MNITKTISTLSLAFALQGGALFAPSETEARTKEVVKKNRFKDDGRKNRCVLRICLHK